MEKFIQLASLLDYPDVLRFSLQKTYNYTKLDSLIYGSNYQRLGGGVIDKKYLKEPDGRKLIENIRKYHILIQTEEEYNNFLTKLEIEQLEAKKNETMNGENWKEELRQAIEENSPSILSLEQKEHIFNIIVSSPSEKTELKKFYWQVFDIIGTANKTITLFKINPNIKIDKNTFKQKDRT